MEYIIRTFTCVVQHTHNADDIVENATALLDGSSNATDISDHDRLGLLDFPDSVIQEANVAATTSLSKAELLERAASSPSTLSAGEIDLLKRRYWLGLTREQMTPSFSSAAKRDLYSLTQEQLQQATDQLKKVRAMLFDANEEDALWNAEMEDWRRMMDASKQRKKQEVESRLPTAQPWMKRLWDEDQAEKNWGYAVFRDLKAANEEYEVRKDAALMNARGAIGCGDTIGARWRLQYLDQPEDDKELEPSQAASDANDKENEKTASELEARFQVLRQHFRKVRDRTLKRQSTALYPQTDRSELRDGILRNVFLVIDQQCVESLSSQTANVDDMWVYAVDPDYTHPTGTTAPEVPSKEYRGYLRVRLQQLVNNFFDARRFHADEFSMQALWTAAQASRNQAFVSVKESEQHLWTFNRFVGSALRPEGVARPTVKLLY
ncbi:hypothetical protein KCU81_g5144, partial [Aureobasidium melanogenum]|uniref:Uncharacterized protein n=1 Tax=Aureobasidium melanogenum (strain CBS 110374) TaxID=1043003 RepID=A0A074VX14_AURM1